MSTLAACLTRIGRIDFDQHPASFFRFARELGKEGRPRGIGNALGKTMIMGHVLHLQVFHTDKPIRIDDLAAGLMGEVLAPPRNPLMHAGDRLAMFPAALGAFGQLGVLALHFGQGFLFLAEKSGVGDLFTGR